MKKQLTISLIISITLTAVAVGLLIAIIVNDPFTKEERFSELFIVSSEVATTTEAIEATVVFGIANHEGTPTLYTYELFRQSASDTSQVNVREGSMLINNDEQYLITETFDLPNESSKQLITVTLPDFDLEVTTNSTQ